ncbi:MAG: hypothetical protein ACRDSH_13080 [Pseudonocardiaceae bacterium]
MTESENIPQDTELDPGSPTGEATAELNQEAGEEEAADGYQEAGEEGLAADYRARMEEFDDAEASAPVTTLPTQSSDLDKSDLEINP